MNQASMSWHFSLSRAAFISFSVPICIDWASGFTCAMTGMAVSHGDRTAVGVNQFHHQENGLVMGYLETSGCEARRLVLTSTGGWATHPKSRSPLILKIFIRSFRSFHKRGMSKNYQADKVVCARVWVRFKSKKFYHRNQFQGLACSSISMHLKKPWLEIKILTLVNTKGSRQTGFQKKHDP